MKPVAEWDEEYIMSLPVGEFDWLETKGRRSLDLTIPNVLESSVLEVMSKEISAFANSGGGQLVYGLTNPKPGDTEWHVDDGGVDIAVKRNGTKEWLETVIPNLMEPALQRFNVYVIPPSRPDSKMDSGRALFVIDVPDSEQAPHQAKDHIYYARVASRASPIRHRMIMDIANRRQHPKIDLRFRLVRYGVKPCDYLPNPPEDVVMLQVTAFNNGRVYASYLSVTIYVPKVISAAVSGVAKPDLGGGVPRPMSGREALRYMLSNDAPILPTLGQKFNVRMSPLLLVSGAPPTDEYIIWYTQADNGEQTNGYCLLRDMEIIDERNEMPPLGEIIQQAQKALLAPPEQKLLVQTDENPPIVQPQKVSGRKFRWFGRGRNGEKVADDVQGTASGVGVDGSVEEPMVAAQLF